MCGPQPATSVTLPNCGGVENFKNICDTQAVFHTLPLQPLTADGSADNSVLPPFCLSKPTATHGVGDSGTVPPIGSKL
jgi:hypothetical protein